MPAGWGRAGERAPVPLLPRAARPPRPSVRSDSAPELLPTVRAAALARPGAAFEVTAGDLRRALRRGREANLIVLLLDTSGSMAACRRGRAVATTALSLLGDAYRRRDRVALLTFRGEAATVVVPDQADELAARRLRDLLVGGRTPLGAGLEAVRCLVRREAWRDPARRPRWWSSPTAVPPATGTPSPRPGRPRPRSPAPAPRASWSTPRMGRSASGSPATWPGTWKAELVTVPDLASPLGARRGAGRQRLADIIRAKEVA